jgi:hypothetical protein
LSKRAAQARHGNGTPRHGTARHSTVRHGGVPCRIVSPCQGRGPGTALRPLNHAVPLGTAAPSAHAGPGSARRRRAPRHCTPRAVAASCRTTANPMRPPLSAAPLPLPLPRAHRRCRSRRYTLAAATTLRQASRAASAPRRKAAAVKEAVRRRRGREWRNRSGGLGAKRVRESECVRESEGAAVWTGNSEVWEDS